MTSRLNWVGCLLFVLALSLSACSTRSWYEGMKMGAENECQKQPPGAREDCLARLNKKTYDAYDKERARTP